MALKFLQKKWHHWFKILNVNHDGKLSLADQDHVITTFTKLHQLDEKRAKQVSRRFVFFLLKMSKLLFISYSIEHLNN